MSRIANMENYIRKKLVKFKEVKKTVYTERSTKFQYCKLYLGLNPNNWDDYFNVSQSFVHGYKISSIHIEN